MTRGETHVAISASLEAEITHQAELVYSSLCQTINFTEEAQRKARKLEAKTYKLDNKQLHDKVSLLSETLMVVENVLKTLTIFLENTIHPVRGDHPCWQ